MSDGAGGEHGNAVGRFGVERLMGGVRLSSMAPAGPTIGLPYSKVVGSNFAIWHVPLAGGTPAQITAGDPDDQETPIVDPVGRDRLVYTQVVSGGDRELHIVNVDGSGDTVIDSGHHRLLDWKPDGSKILFTTFNTGEEHQILEINPDGTGRTAIYSATPGDYLNRARYSDDGSKIAFLRNVTTVGPSHEFGEVWVMDADGSNDLKLDDIYDGYVSDNAVAWSHDGLRVAYGDGGNPSSTGPGSPYGHWYAIDIDGTDRTDLGSQADAGAEAYFSRSAWAPDDSFVLVEQWTNDNRWSLQALQADGSGAALLSPTYRVFDGPILFYPDHIAATRVYALAYIEPVFSGTDLESVLSDGTGRRVEDAASAVDILLEWFE